MELRCVALSAYAAERLGSPGTYRLSAHFAHVLDLTAGETVLSIQDAAIPRTPLSLVLEDDDLQYLSRRAGPRSVFTAGGGGLALGDVSIAIRAAERFSCQLTACARPPEAIWRRRLRRLAVLMARPGSLTFIAAPELTVWADGGLTAVQREAAALLGLGRPQALVGLGGGLTPAGDDFLVGALAALEWLGSGPVRQELAREAAKRLGETPELSRAFLSRALAGDYSLPVLDLFAALAAGSETDLAAAVARLCAVGHSSGSDLLGGVLWALERNTTWEGNT